MIDWYAQRDDISRLVALVALGLLLSPLLKYRPSAKALPPEELFAVQMVAPPEAVAPPPAPSPVPRPLPARTHNSLPVPDAPVRDEEVVAASALLLQPSVARVPARIAAPPLPAPAEPPPMPHPARVEDAYVASVRGYLTSIKRYPTGREASIRRPRGKTRVWFTLGRDGQLQSSGIDESSDSLLLDRSALATVQRGGFPVFPDAAWSGQASHRFTVELEFIPAS